MIRLKPITHKKNHAVMFHYFHNENHPHTQGSLSESDFVEMIGWLKEKFNLLGANEYEEKFRNGFIDNGDICLTFDDALKCQYDIAIPILDKLNIKAFFFVYTSIFTNNPNPLEIYRYFRNSSYSNIDYFYKDFFEIVKRNNPKKYEKRYQEYKNINHLSAFPFYTENDRWFRYLRDFFFLNDDYHKIMYKLMANKKFDIEKAKKNLWISKDDLKNISNQGHTIGLHTHSHPTLISKLSITEQENEYIENNMLLTKLIGKSITSMSHPCGDYNKETLNILTKMNIKIGFRSNMSITKIKSPLEIPREDSTNIYRKMYS